LKLLPKSLNGLWALGYALAATSTNIETLRQAFEISVDILEIDTDSTLPLAETQRLAHELLMARAKDLKLTLQTLQSAEFRASAQIAEDMRANPVARAA